MSDRPDPAEAVREALAHLPSFIALNIERYSHGGGRAWRDGEDGRDLVLDLYAPHARREAILDVLIHAPALLARLDAAERDAEHEAEQADRYRRIKEHYESLLVLDGARYRQLQGGGAAREVSSKRIGEILDRLSAAEARAGAAEACAKESAEMYRRARDRADAAWSEALEAAAEVVDGWGSHRQGIYGLSKAIRALPAPSEGEAKR